MLAFSFQQIRNTLVQVMDATKMELESETFDYVLDKGTLDALMVQKFVTSSESF